MRSVPRRLSSLALAALLVAMVGTAPASAGIGVPRAAIIQPGNTILVNDGADVVADDGLCTLREAITAANDNLPSGTTAGECFEGSPGEADTIQIKDIGAADLTVLISTGDLPQITSDLIIDGTGGGSIAASGTPYRPFDVPSGVTLTLRNLFVYDIATTSLGGAMLLSGTAIIENTDFQATTDARGGAVRVAPGGTLTATSAYFQSSADLGGGAIWNEGTVTLVGSRVSGSAGSDGGGGIFNAVGATLTVRSTVFQGNQAIATSGGALSNLGTATIANSVLWANTADGAGGAIADEGTLTIIHSTIIGNSAAAGAGIETAGSPLVTNSIVTNNPDGINESGIDGTIDAASSGNVLTLPTAALTDWMELGDVPKPLVVAGSPIVDKAPDGPCASAPILGVDIRGVPRPAGACDVGAVERDTIAPTVPTAPRVSFLTGQQLSGSSASARVGWAGSDTGGSGIAYYLYEVQVDGGPWQVAGDDIVVVRTAWNVTLANGHAYRYRVRAFDMDQNASAYVYSPTVKPKLVQQTSTAVSYRGTWTRADSTKYSGGSVRYAKARGASASLTATGRAYSFVSTTGPNRGKARIYVNGVLKATVDLRSDSTRYRVQAWSIRYSTSASRTIKVVVLGTDGRPRVDLDAIYVLR